MKAAPPGLVMLLNDRPTHVFCPSLQDMTEDLIILIKAVHVPDTKADSTTPNWVTNKFHIQKLPLVGQTQSETTVGVKFTHKSRMLAIWSPALWFSNLSQKTLEGSVHSGRGGGTT